MKHRELLREHVVGTHRVPGFGGHLLLWRLRLGNVAEVHVRQIADLVVVVEHDAPVPRDAEVLQQHVARKDVRRGELA
jgi:hypothetical protein